MNYPSDETKYRELRRKINMILEEQYINDRMKILMIKELIR